MQKYMLSPKTFNSYLLLNITPIKYISKEHLSISHKAQVWKEQKT